MKVFGEEKEAKLLEKLSFGGYNKRISSNDKTIGYVETLNLSVADLIIKLYKDCRHELLNELNRDEISHGRCLLSRA